jgi:hypothetical protein
VDHFQPGCSRADLSETAQSRAFTENVALVGGEVEKPQRYGAGAVGQPTQQRPAAPKCYLGKFYLPLDQDLFPGPQTPETANLGAVFVSLRQHAKDVANRFDAQPRQSLAQPGSDSGKRRGRPIEECLIGLR